MSDTNPTNNNHRKKLSLYDILEISPAASPEIVRASYLALAKKYHPDVCKTDPQKAANMMRAINYAYSVLSNPMERARYDATLAANKTESNSSRDTQERNSHASPETTKKKNPKSKHLETIVSVIFTCLLVGILLVSLVLPIVDSFFMSQASTTKPSNSIAATTSKSNTSPSYVNSDTKSALLQYMENKVEPEPENGEVLSGQTTIHGTEITVTASRTEACVVKLKNNSGKTALSFYVRAGNTVSIGVPCGFYDVYFACGSSWVNRTKLFGDKTSYSKDSETLDFINYSWEYTLQPTTYGNFNETHINANEFNE